MPHLFRLRDVGHLHISLRAPREQNVHASLVSARAWPLDHPLLVESHTPCVVSFVHPSYFRVPRVLVVANDIAYLEVTWNILTELSHNTTNK